MCNMVGMNTPCVWRGLSNVQCDEVMAHRMVWWRLVGAVPVCPPVSPCKGASIVKIPCTMRVFLVWKRRCADVRAGTQAPPLRFRLGRLHDAFPPPMCVVWWGRGLFLQQYWPYCLSLVKLKCRVGIISSVARRALHICKWLRSILGAWGWNGFRAGRRPPSLCARHISRLSFGSR